MKLTMNSLGELPAVPPITIRECLPIWRVLRWQSISTEHVKFRTLLEVTMASCTYQGSYTQITDVYAAVIAWMEANGYEPAEPMFNIYHVSPHETQNPDEFVTEICYPVKKK
jgi:Transcriptional regulator, effector-binding domain/component